MVPCVKPLQQKPLASVHMSQLRVPPVNTPIFHSRELRTSLITLFFFQAPCLAIADTLAGISLGWVLSLKTRRESNLRESSHRRAKYVDPGGKLPGIKSL